MSRNSNNSRESSKRPRNPALRRRRIFTGLLLALVAVSAGYTLPAQAAPAGATELKFFMLAVKEGHIHAPICKGEHAHINVLVYRRKVIDGVDSGSDVLPGVSVTGAVGNPAIGKISPNPSTTTAAGSIYPGAADFVFTADNEGETGIAFIGIVAIPGWFGTNFRSGAEKVAAHVDVNVIPCKEEVTTTMELHDVAEDITMITDQAVMTRDAAGTFTGSTTLYYVYAMATPCDHTVSATDSHVDLTGRLEDDGRQFVATETFQPTTLTITISCPLVATINRQTRVTVDPLTFTVASSGGVSIQTFMGGMARIVVVPEDDKPAALNLENPGALVGPISAWMGLLWDELPGLDSARLAVR